MTLTQSAWLAQVKKLSRDRESSAFLLGDCINQGIETYGKTAAYKLAMAAIRRSQRALYLLSHVARRFEPSRRVPELSFIHHAVVASFPAEIVDELLQQAVTENWTCKRLRSEAEARCGIQKPNSRRKKVVIWLGEQNVEHLKELADGKQVNWFVVGVIEDFLRSKGFTVPERLTTAERRKRWQASGKCIFCGTNSADQGNRACGDCRQKNADRQKNASKTPELVKAAEPVPEPQQPTQEAVAPTPTVPAAEPETPRPTYAERRQQQLAAGASPIAPKKKCTCRIRVLWTECRPKSFVEDNDGNITRLQETVRCQPTCFKN